MLSTYAAVLRTPGALAMSFATFLARLPFAMIGLGTVLLVSSRQGSYALAGALSAVIALLHAVVGPLPARAMDRFGQHRVLPLLTTSHVVALTAFVLLVLRDEPTPWLFLTAAVTGATLPDAGAIVRARWALVLAGRPDGLRTAFAYEGVIDEMVFVLGPPLATAVAVGLVDWGALAMAGSLLALGTLLLVPQRRTEPPAGGAAHVDGPSALRFPGVIEVALVFVLLGGLFGAFEVATIAFADERGSRGVAGLLIGLYAVGSAAAGLALGAATVRIALHRQLRLAALVLAVVTVPFPFIGSVTVLAVVCLLSGVAVSPVLISSYALIERLVPNRFLTEALVWTTAGLGVGIAGAAAGAGALVDASGANAAYALATACASATLLAMLVAFPRLDRAWVAGYGDGRSARTPVGRAAGIRYDHPA